MNILSIIGTGWAWKRYKAAKEKYEAAVAQKAAQDAIIQNFIDHRDEAFDEALTGGSNPNQPIKGVQAASVLYHSTGYASFRGGVTVTIANNSDYDYRIYHIEVKPRLLGEAVSFTPAAVLDTDVVVNKGETKVITVVKNATGKMTDELWSEVYKYTHEARQNSSSVIWDFERIEKADITIDYKNKHDAGQLQHARYELVEGILSFGQMI